MSKELFSEAEGKLYSYNQTKAEIESIKLDIQEIESEYRGCGAICYGDKSGNTYNISKSIETEILNKEKRLEKLKKKLESKERAIKKIDNSLNVLSDSENDIVKYRYFNNRKLGWKTVANKVGMSESRCKQLRTELIDKIKEIV